MVRIWQLSNTISRRKSSVESIKMAEIIGYYYFPEIPNISDVLMYVNSTIIANSKCGKSFPTYIKPTHICISGAGGKAACNVSTKLITRNYNWYLQFWLFQGDSGGPMTTLVKGVRKQIGIVSFGTSTGCSSGYPSVFTRVTSYLDWIQTYTDVIIG